MINAMEPLFADRSGWRRVYDTVAPGERYVVAGTSYGGHLARGLVHHRGAQIDGLLLNVPAIEQDATKQHFPQPLTVHEDSVFLSVLAADEEYMRELFAGLIPIAASRIMNT